MAVCFSGGTQWRCWLRQCATIRKVAVSIPDGVTGIFHWHSPSDHTMALGWTQHLRGRTARRPDNLTTFVCCLSWNLGTSTFRNPLGKIRVCLLIFFHSSETQLLTYYSTRCEDHSTNIHHMWKKKLSFSRNYFYLISAANISNIIQHIKLRGKKKVAFGNVWLIKYTQISLRCTWSTRNHTRRPTASWTSFEVKDDYLQGTCVALENRGEYTDKITKVEYD